MLRRLLRALSLPSVPLLSALGLLSACGGSGGGGDFAGPDPVQSSFTASTPFGTPADGVASVELVAVVADRSGNPLEDVQLELRVSGFGHGVIQPPPTDADGVTRGSLVSTVGEVKTVRAVAIDGVTERELGSLTTEFVRLLPGHCYVRATGSDADDGTSPLSAWRTLAFAVDRLQPGETLHVGAGTYAPFRVSTLGTAETPVHILADSAGRFTGDAGEVIVDATGSAEGIGVDGARHLVLRGFTVFGAAGGIGLRIGPRATSDVLVSEVSLFENDCGLDAHDSLRLTVEGARVSNNLGDGIRLGRTQDTSVLNNLVYNNGGVGLRCDDVSLNLTVGLNTFHKNLGAHLAESGPGSTGLLTANVFTEGGAASVSLSSGTQLEGDVNLSFANNVGPVALPGASLSIFADPLFLDEYGPDGILGGIGAADDNFRLTGRSPALDAGIVDARQVRLLGAGSAARKSSRASGLRDGEQIDGDRINLGFHYPVSLDPFASAAPGALRVAHASPREAVVRAQLLEEGTTQWSPPAEAWPANANVRWLVHRVAPAYPEELAAALVDTGEGTELFVRHWDGRRWNDDLELPAIRTIARADAGQRGFDAAYESLSSDALVVHANGDGNPYFRTLVGGIWSAPAPVLANAPAQGRVLWIELVPHAASDRVALLVLDDQGSLRATIWDGDTWGSEILLETRVVEGREFRSFDAAWETLSGDLLVAWGFSVFAEQARLATYDGSAGTWTAGLLFTNADAVGSLIRLRSDPVSDRIVAAFGEGTVDDDVVISIWDGDAFTDTREVTLAGVAGQHSLAVGWIGATGKAFALWREPNGNTFERATFDAFWTRESPVRFAGAGRAVRMVVPEHTTGDHTELLFQSDTGALFAAEVRLSGKGSVWSLTNLGRPLASGLGTDARTQVFSADRR